MPITRSAKKALRSSLRKKSVNDRRKKNYKEAVKKVTKLVKGKNKDEGKKSLALAYKAIDKAAKQGVISKNTAARRKSLVSRMTK
jgi:small subunit ribosomal protein S20